RPCPVLRRPPPLTPCPYTTLFRSPLPAVRRGPILCRPPLDHPPGQGAGSDEGARGPRRTALPRRRHCAQSGLGGSRRAAPRDGGDRKSTRLNSSHVKISYAVFCLK